MAAVTITFAEVSIAVPEQYASEAAQIMHNAHAKAVMDVRSLCGAQDAGIVQAKGCVGCGEGNTLPGA